MPTKERSRRTVRSVCFALLVTAAVFRLGMELRQSGLQQAALFLSLGISAEPSTPDSPSSAAESTTAKQQPTYEKMEYPWKVPWVAPAFSAQDAALVQITNRVGAELDPEALISQPVQIDLSVDGPVILILHTHATEAYTMTDASRYEETSAYRTDDTAYNVVRVGQAMADRLNALGIETLHDTELHDLNGYNDSYARTRETIAAYLDAYPSLQMVIDVHRDAIDAGDGTQLAMTAEINGEEYARLMLVMGTDFGGLEHPNWRDNLSLAMKLQAQGEKNTSGVFRALSLCDSRFNEHMTPNSLLIEVGTAGNTLPQALNSAEFFADVLVQVLRGA